MAVTFLTLSYYPTNGWIRNTSFWEISDLLLFSLEYRHMILSLRRSETLRYFILMERSDLSSQTKKECSVSALLSSCEASDHLNINSSRSSIIERFLAWCLMSSKWGYSLFGLISFGAISPKSSFSKSTLFLIYRSLCLVIYWTYMFDPWIIIFNGMIKIKTLICVLQILV